MKAITVNSKRWTHKVVPLPLILLGLVASGCGDDGTSPEEELDSASFTATVSGALSRSFSGVATFSAGTDPETGESAWVLYLSTGGNNPTAATDLIWFAGIGAPSEGTKSVTDLAETGDLPEGGVGGFVFVTDQSAGTIGTFLSQSGELRINSLSASRMDGTFTFTADGTIASQPPVEGSITVQGSFQAENGLFLLPFG